MNSIEPRIDLGNVNADLRDRTLERAEAQALFVLLLAHQTDLGEYPAALLGDAFETDSLIAHQPPYKPEKGSSQSRIHVLDVIGRRNQRTLTLSRLARSGRDRWRARRRLLRLERDAG